MATPPPPSIDDLIARNVAYIPTHTTPQIFVPGIIPPPGTKRLIVLTCMDHRVQPQGFLGLKDDAVVIRNAGGRARHAIFDIALLDTLVGVAEIVVVHHTNCGLTLTTDEHIKTELVARSAGELGKWETAFEEGGGVCFTDVGKSVKEDVEFLRRHKWLKRKELRVSGLVYDTEKGSVERVDF